jgi:hypothetical protein
MYKLKSRGEIFDPWGTPAVIFFIAELVSFMRTAKQRSERKDLIILKMAGWVFNVFNLNRRPSCQTRSNACAISKNAAPV